MKNKELEELEELEEFHNIIDEEPDDQSTSIPERETKDSAEDTNDFEATANARMWAVYGNAYTPCEKAVKSLPPGQYTIEYSHDKGIYFSHKSINLDELLILPDSASEEVINSIETFWTKEQHFREFKFLWKRGVLLWGPAGSGKTSTLQIISKNIIDKGGISVYVDEPSIGAKGLEILRKIEPNRPIVVMLEDIDTMIEQHGETSLLALLDGELQIDNVVFISTTNYPGRLDKRLRNRPSRFDIVKKIGMPSYDARKLYLTTKNPRLNTPQQTEELIYWIKQTDGLSLAHLKELIISVEVFELDVNDAIQRLKKMSDIKYPINDDDTDNNAIGFTT